MQKDLPLVCIANQYEGKVYQWFVVNNGGGCQVGIKKGSTTLSKEVCCCFYSLVFFGFSLKFNPPILDWICGRNPGGVK